MTTTLPPRRGPRPTTTPTNPHTQLDQQPDDLDQRQRLAETVFTLDGVREQESLISVPGARALWLELGADGPDEAFMAGHEFAHLHPGDDQSLHLMLPEPPPRDAMEEGLADLPPVAWPGRLPPTAVTVYAPRAPQEPTGAAARGGG